MAKKFDMRQLNNLLTGNSLAAEIPASSAELRAFVVVSAYKKGGGRPSKLLSAADQNDLLFLFMKYEVEREYIDSWDYDHYMHDLVRKKGIASIEALEQELGNHLDDLLLLDVSWRVGNPL